jgi:hypothetical protein
VGSVTRGKGRSRVAAQPPALHLRRAAVRFPNRSGSRTDQPGGDGGVLSGAFESVLELSTAVRRPELVTNAKSKQRRVYRWYATPWQILRQLPGIARYLKAGMTIEDLDRKARAQSDTTAAGEMQRAKAKLFARVVDQRAG